MTERLVVIGGDAAGMSAAMQVRRRQPDREIVVLERGRWTSYSACGIPYLVGGSVGDLDDLVARSPETFRADHDIDVRLGHEVRALDLDAREVEAWDHHAGRLVRLGFDTLHIATGARPLRPDLPGIDDPMVFGVQTLDDAAALVAGGERIGADLVVLGLGTRPNSGLAAEAGIEVGVKEAIRVDRRQRTSVDGVWAAGDCCESYHLVARAPVHIALGTVANKQGRVAGINMAGGYAAFPGALGTAVTKVCDVEIGRTGLSRAEVERHGFLAVEASIDGESRAGYLPERKRIMIKALAEVGTGRMLGAQIVGEEGTAKRIDVLATAIQAGLSAEEVVELDLGYAPPFGPVWDPVHLVARDLVRALDIG